jgi:hypothetical protein
MARHVLSLDAHDTLNCTILRIEDTSVYTSDLKIECPILEITLPGFTSAVQIGDDKIDSGFRLNLTACDLGVQSNDCGTNYSNLPDGVYVIKYSISPNDTVYVEYNHLRVSQLLNNLQKVLCELDIAACDPNTVTEAKLRELHLIREFINAAKAKVETCHEPKKGMELYTYAKKLLSKFECTSCY